MNTTPPKFSVPYHLGGHFGNAHIDLGILQAIREKYPVATALDIGCGTGEMVTRMRDRNIRATGIEGDLNLAARHPHIIGHDYARGPLDLGPHDLAWSTEFLEHVWDRNLPNVLTTLAPCRHILATAAPPGRGGHHHVNCQPAAYWIDLLASAGFGFEAEFTDHLKARSVPLLYMRDGTTRPSAAFDSALFFTRRS